MSDYISREAAVEAACRGCNEQFGEEPCEPNECCLLFAVKTLPVADVRPVVLCENCIYLTNGTCRIPFLKSDESYCSWGRDYREVQDDED